MRSKLLATILSIALVSLISLITLTDPTSLSSTVLLVPFLLLFVVIWCLAYGVFRSIGASKSRSLRLPFVCAGVPTGLLLLQSIGQLTIWDAVIVLVFAGIAYFYVMKASAKTSE